jgi:6-phosphogluconolactonase (cycloisomerase 2 family)
VAPSWIPAGGKGPRFATLDPTGTWLYCANERSDTITRFRRDPATGDLTAADPPVATGSPVCLVFQTQ